MRMTPEHFETLRKALGKVKAEHPNLRQRYLDTETLNGDRDKRFRWDAMYSAPIAGYERYCEFLVQELYPYLHDAHIDTALRRIANELWPLSNPQR